MLTEDIVVCILLFIFIIIGQYTTYKTIGTTIRQDRIHLKETSYYELGKKVINHKKEVNNHADMFLISELERDIEEDIKILLKKDG